MFDINFGCLSGKISSDPKLEIKNNYSTLYFTVDSNGFGGTDKPPHVNSIEFSAKGNCAEKLNGKLKLGDDVLVQYKLNYATWQSQNYQTKQLETRKKVFIVADSVKILNDNDNQNGENF